MQGQAILEVEQSSWGQKQIMVGAFNNDSCHADSYIVSRSEAVRGIRKELRGSCHFKKLEDFHSKSERRREAILCYKIGRF